MAFSSFSSIVIAPNAFKGTLSAKAAAEAMARGAQRVFPDETRILCPLPDGGDGTLDILTDLLKATDVSAVVTTADGRKRAVRYAVADTGRGPVALMESAAVIGLDMAGDVPIDRRTTRGLGELIVHALDAGIRRFFIGLGGSATWDAGVGMLGALGVQFAGLTQPCLADLTGIARVDICALDSRIHEARWTLLADVDNPFSGPQGSIVYAAQKGADVVQRPAFARVLAHAARLLEDAFACPGAARTAHAGAAGGIGFAFALLGGHLRPGARFVARLGHLDRAVAQSVLVLTGEGACDSQTASGKGPRVVADLALRHGRPAIIICGRIDASFAKIVPNFSHYEQLLPADTAAEAVAQATERALRHFLRR